MMLCEVLSEFLQSVYPLPSNSAGWSKKADTRFIFAITSANEHRF